MMEMMTALNIVRQIQQLTMQQVADKMNAMQREYPQPGDKDFTEKEISRLFNSGTEPRVRTFNMVKAALGLRHDPLRYL